VDDHPPIARLVKATVIFDTTVARYFAAIGECGALRRAFPRALITTGVLRELQLAQRPVEAAGGDLGPLLDEPAWAEVLELTGPQIVDVEQLRLAFHDPEELLARATTDLGEFETIVGAQLRGGLPIVIEDARGAGVARGRGLACYQAIHVCMIAAIRGLIEPPESWAMYGRLLEAGLKPRNPDRVAFRDDVRSDYLAIVGAAMDVVRGRRQRKLGGD
jgi:predicted nucleic acid-binding protein